MKNLKPFFEDAQQLAIDHPDTFEAPNQEELDRLKVNDIVKVCVQGERFWTQIKDLNEHYITATVDNDLVKSDLHGLDYGDIVVFERKNIYQIFAT